MNTTAKTTALCLILAVMAVLGGCFVDPTIADITVSIRPIVGVAAPAEGVTPVSSITPTNQFTGTVSWEPAHSAFQVYVVYTATIELTATEGYTFQGIEADFFTVEDAESVNNPADTGVVTVVFKQLDGK